MNDLTVVILSMDYNDTKWNNINEIYATLMATLASIQQEPDERRWRIKYAL